MYASMYTFGLFCYMDLLAMFFVIYSLGFVTKLYISFVLTCSIDYCLDSTSIGWYSTLYVHIVVIAVCTKVLMQFFSSSLFFARLVYVSFIMYIQKMWI